MITLKHILVPTDFSETSEAAAKYGVALARAFNATLHLLHVEPRRDLQIIVERELVVEKYLSDPTAATSAQNAARELLGKILTEQEEKELRAEYVLRASGSGRSVRRDRPVRQGTHHRLDRHGDAWTRLRGSYVDGQRGRKGGAKGAVPSAHRAAPRA